jgi:hypothetical protein
LTLDSLFMEIRARSAAFPPCAGLPQALDSLAGPATLPGSEGIALRKLITALMQVHTEPQFDSHDIDPLTPSALVAMGEVVSAIMDGRCSQQRFRDAFRPLFVRVTS